MSSSSMGHSPNTPPVGGHSSTLDPSGSNTPRPSMRSAVISGGGYRGPVKVLILAPFQYEYKAKSYWVTSGEWYSLDPIKDREEILYLDSPSNPYRQFMYMEGQGGVGTVEEKGDVYEYGTGYQELASDPAPPLRSNALLPPEEPGENPHILETLARARALQAIPLVIEEEVVPALPTGEADLPRYGDEVLPDVAIDVAVVEGIPVPTVYEVRESELRSMKVPALKALALTMGIEYRDKESTIKQILEQ